MAHYEVIYCCVAEQAGTEAADVHLFQKLEGYHGEMAVDVETGVIRRLTLQAEMKADDPVVKANLMVEYGPVEIGGRLYTCPVRSVSSLRAQSVQVDPNFHYELAHQLQPLKNELADVTFKDYHVFRAETRVLTATEAADAEKAAPAPKNAPARQAAVQGEAAPGSTAGMSSAVPPSSVPADEGCRGERYGGGKLPAITATAACCAAAGRSRAAGDECDGCDDLAGAGAGAQAPLPNTGFTLRTTTRLVEVAVVATDKHGHPITDLKPEDLEIYDNGRSQAVKDFAQAGMDVESASPARRRRSKREQRNRWRPTGPRRERRRRRGRTRETRRCC